jgi:hypothetical protein
LEKLAQESDNQRLQNNNKADDDPEQFAGANIGENVNFVLNSAATHKVEDLKEHEGVE